MPFPMTSIEHVQVSRVLCGTNPFFGFSHFSAARDAWLRNHFTKERILEVLEACRLEGINGTISSPNPFYHEILREHERQTGHHWVWMCTPGGNDWKEVEPGVKWCADHGVEICLPHQGFTDNNLIPAENRIAGGPEILQCIRDNGMIPGWSTHRPETIIVSDKAGYDVATYILPYNSIGFLCPVETDWTGRVIRETPKPVICIKPLGAGRVMPPTGLSFVFGSNKPTDTVAIGFLGPGEAKEDITIARDLIEGREREYELQYTRSKASLVR
ncbi:MAG TPA: hypothetical protein PLT86_11310 [Candidatus Latescibacteria bacterium]|nr:hypothetical protein [Candidatus Latescibacterota bacterium]